MPRLLFGLCAGVALVALACNDELVETVPKDVCYSEMRWIGGKRGSPEMYPGEDCVGCHRDNDGPPLALGGTLYAYSPFVLPPDQLAVAQTGEHCFGVEGITVTIEDADGQTFEVVTNRAGNFYVEGNPDDFAKPFNVALIGYTQNADGQDTITTMATRPYYGGCARCHNPAAPPIDEDVDSTNIEDPNFRSIVPRIGLFAYRLNGPNGPLVDDEIKEFVGQSAATP